jgi:cytochrome c|tara:strand:- start:1062 stop:1553 length:492 start_codon:yes stop_codon:yes gene_type:complete
MDRNLRLKWSCFFVVGLIVFIGCKEVEKSKVDISGQVNQTPLVDPEPTFIHKVNPSQFVNGERVYKQNCLVCHQVSGGGVSGLNPPLKDTEYVLGEKDRLLGIILNGSNVGLSIKGSTYSNAMPGFGSLSDEDIANVATFIRNSFGNSADPITIEDVARYRMD